MRYMLIIAALLVSSSASAGSGFFLGGVSEGFNGSSNDYQRQLDRDLDRARERRLIEENNRILQDQADRQQRQDTNRIFGIQRR